MVITGLIARARLSATAPTCQRVLSDLPSLAIALLFNSSVAGNISNHDMLGSMAFSCVAAGAKVVLGYARCDAVRGAIDNAEQGHLTGLLNEIKLAIEKTEYQGERKGSNYDSVDVAARKNVELTIENIRKNSPVLKQREDQQKIKIIGSMYHLSGDTVEFLYI